MKILFALLALSLLLSSSGCAAIGLSDEPKSRMGSLPFHGPFALYESADPNRLGEHRYDGMAGFNAEKQRGIMYACRAGFIDVAHIRKATDWARYNRDQVQEALAQGHDSMTLSGREPSRYLLEFNYPADWNQLPASERQQMIDELSIVIGQRMSWLMLSWHEIITLYGYKSWGFVSEKRSAFTYDDMVSHMIGVVLAGDAMRDTRDFDEAMTFALRQEMDRIHAVGPKQTDEAIARVKGDWWSGGTCIKRHLDIGLNGEPVVPWLVSGLSFCSDATPVDYYVPILENVNGRNMSDFYTVAISPRVLESRKIKSLFSPKPDYIDPDLHFPRIMEDCRERLVRQYGADVDRP